jgi:hypothetical protein
MKSPIETAGFDQSTFDGFGVVRSADTGLSRSPNLLDRLKRARIPRQEVQQFGPEHRKVLGRDHRSRRHRSLLVLPIIDTAHRAPLLKGKALGHPAICRHGRMWQRDDNAANWLHTQTTSETYGIEASGATVGIN